MLRTLGSSASLWLAGLFVPLAAAPSTEPPAAVTAGAAVNRTLPVVRVPVTGSGVVDLADRARASTFGRPGPLDVAHPMRLGGGSRVVDPLGRRGVRSLVSHALPSPAPTFSFPGLDDIPMLDSGIVVIPPDVNGAVGPARIFQNLKNNVRILDKATGAVVSTVGINTFWAASGASPNRYSDPRSVYDPYHGRFIAIMLADQGLTFSNSICLGLSDGDDPAGSWHLYRIPAYQDPTYLLADFPTLGFSRNWITIAFNAYSLPPMTGRRSVFMVHYPTLRQQNTAVVYRTNDPTPDLICASPCVTYSATCDTQYVVQRRGTSTYSLDRIHGVGPDAPTYEVGPTLTRPGGEWNGLSDLANTLPQSGPEAGASSCGDPPCPIERTDDHVRAPAVYRGGFVWFAQQVGLPAVNPAYAAVQWTQVATPGGEYVTGGRLQDTLATFTNGRPHYSYPSIAVNADGDFLLGFTRFSSSQHPAAGYAIHLAADGPGTLRDTIVFKDGEDYYHRVREAAPTRNRWGDFSTSQVDPVDDHTLWTVQPYARSRVGTDDGNALTNSSRWGTWWAGVVPAAMVSVPAGERSRDAAFAIVSASPNPGSGSVRIRYVLPRAAHVRLTLLDLQGRVVSRLVDAMQSAGAHDAAWSERSPAGDARPGIYLACLDSPEGLQVRRIVRLR